MQICLKGGDITIAIKFLYHSNYKLTIFLKLSLCLYLSIYTFLLASLSQFSYFCPYFTLFLSLPTSQFSHSNISNCCHKSILCKSHVPVVPSRYCPPESRRIISFLPTSLQLSVTALKELLKGTKRR